jgi:hypothetical protein
MAVTPNFGWPTPNDSDDANQGAAAIRALGDAIDSTVDGIDGRVTDAEGDIDGLKDGSLLPAATTSVAGAVLGTTSDLGNTALGSNAFAANTTGDRNVAVGENALAANTTGTGNVAVGRNALDAASTDSDNTAVGDGALTNTVNFRNTGVGALALRDNTTGENNAAVGRAVLLVNTTGSGNAAMGRGAMLANTTGSDNSAFGRNALSNLTTGGNNTGLGNGSTASSATVSNEITLGNASVTTLRCQQTTITALSDARDKTDVTGLGYGIEFVNRLRPVQFTWDARDGSQTDVADIGFIAQELAAVEDETGDAERLRLTLRNNPDRMEATPGRLLPILVKAVQELSEQNAELRARIETLEG